MFYPEDCIKSLLKCPECNKTFNDPRLLPCGESFCNECIVTIVKQDQTGLECKYCNMFHLVPSNGFPVNQRLYLMTKETAFEVFRGEAIENLKEKINEIKVKIENLTNNKQNGAMRIKDHCDFIRSEVDLAAESAICEINKLRDGLLGQIFEYEQNCLKNLEENSKRIEKLETIIETNNDFLLKWNKKIKEYNLTDEDAKEANTLANISLEEIETVEKWLKETQFNGNQIELKERYKFINSDLLGQIDFLKIQPTIIFNCELKETIELNECCWPRSICRFADGDIIYFDEMPEDEEKGKLILLDYASKKEKSFF